MKTTKHIDKLANKIAIPFYFHNENKADGTICVTETEFNLPYGVVETEGIKLNGFQEKPSYRKLINAGIYVLNPNLISLIKSEEYLDMPNLLINSKVTKKNQK